ncbi:MAG: ABC transporter ATP-binding protein, partial [Caldilineaceae bacterium]
MSQATVAKDPRKEQPRPERPPTGPTLRRLLAYVMADKRRFWSMIVLVLFGVILSVSIPFFIGQAINAINPETGSMALLVRNTLIIAALGVGLWVVQLLANRNLAGLAQSSLLKLRTDLFAHIQKLSIGFYDRQPIGELMSRVTNDLDAVDRFFSSGLSQSYQAILTIVITIIVMLFLNVWLTVVTVVAIPLMLGLALLLGRIAGPAFAGLQVTLGETNGYMEETLAGDKTIIAYGQQARATGDLQVLSDEAREIGTKAQFVALNVGPLLNIIQSTQAALIALVGAIMAINGQIEYGLVVTFTTYSAQLQSPIQQLGQIYNTLLQAVAGGARVFSIMDETPTVEDKPTAKDLALKGGHVVFKDVDFSYVRGRKILKHNSFEARPGQKIGLCGPTGAGKSTIINILTRYYDIDSGTITIDGQNIADLTQKSLRTSITAVLQEAFLFSDTVMNNLKYARAGATDAECIAAAKEANCHDFIMLLPRGYETVLTERGANLSQGQRQMLTIARAMVAQPKMLILDEATSNVD